MKKKLYIFMCLAAFLAPLSCSADKIIIKSGEKYDLKVDIEPFLKAGCKPDSDYLNCSKPDFYKKFECQNLTVVDMLGGLKTPILECLIDYKAKHKMGVRTEGCLTQINYIYLIPKDGRIERIKSQEEFVKLFTPIRTKEAALSFAIAMTGANPYFETPKEFPNFEKEDRFKVIKSKVDGTSVKEIGDKFKVRLFKGDWCGCGDQPFYAIDYLVSKDGHVEEAGKTEIITHLDRICVD